MHGSESSSNKNIVGLYTYGRQQYLDSDYMLQFRFQLFFWYKTIYGEIAVSGDKAGDPPNNLIRIKNICEKNM
jgi:hypothetical protein